MQQGGAIHYGRRGVGGVGRIPSAYKTVSHNTMLITNKKKEMKMSTKKIIWMYNKPVCNNYLLSSFQYLYLNLYL